MRRFFTLGAILLALSPAVAQGQACLGLPSFNAPVHLNAGLLTGNNAMTIGAGVSWGSPAGFFGGVNAAFVDIDEIDENAFQVGGSVGYQIYPSGPRPASSSTNVRPLQICPVGSVQYQMGPEFDFLGETLDLSALSLSAGLNLGVPVVAGTSLELIPTGGAALVYTKVEADGSLGSDSSSETFGIITLGLGFLFNTTFSAKPFVEIPVGLEGADAQFGVLVSFALGGRR